MPRKNPISKADDAIRRRLLKLRILKGMSRDDWSGRSGVSSGLIARIELGRMPLPYETARQLLPALAGATFWSNLTPINPLWLAEGIEPIQLSWPLMLPAADRIALTQRATFALFVDLSREFLVPLILPVREMEKTRVWLVPPFWLHDWIEHWEHFRGQQEQMRKAVEFMERLIVQSAEIQKANGDKTAAEELDRYNWLKNPGAAGKLSLTDAASSGKPASVKPQLPGLLERVRKLTGERGALSQLADDLHVPLASVSRWLAQDREPGGELTLQLLEWVRRREAK